MAFAWVGIRLFFQISPNSDLDSNQLEDNRNFGQPQASLKGTSYNFQKLALILSPCQLTEMY